MDKKPYLTHALNPIPSCLLVLYVCLILVHQPVVAQKVFTVNVAMDTPDIFQGNGVCADINGNCSLRAAIMQANASVGVDTIHFNIPGSGPVTIEPNYLYDPITESLVIDGTTQPTYSPGNPSLILSGSAMGAGGEGLTLVANGCIIRGLVIGGFIEDQNGDFGTAISIINAQNCIIEGNFIGIDADGLTPFPNFTGISMDVFASNNTIGGTTPTSGNVISGNRSAGIALLLNSSSNLIKGNYIGTDKTGMQAVGNYNGIVFDNGSSLNIIGGISSSTRNIISGNTKRGIEITNASSNIILGNYIGSNKYGTAAISNGVGIFLLASAAQYNQIGSNTPSSGNLISGNDNMGIDLQGSFNTIMGNLIGVKIDGASALPNGAVGIWIRNGYDNQIGGNSIEAGNIIAHHTGDGIRVDNGMLSNALRNKISHNAIFANANLGIDLGYDQANTQGNSYNDEEDADSGPNQLQSFADMQMPIYYPETQSLSITYHIPSAPIYAAYPLSVEFFIADERGQGQTCIGSDIYALIDYLNGPTKTILLASPIPITAMGNLVNTVTDASNNTSEFFAEPPLNAGTLSFSAEVVEHHVELRWSYNAGDHQAYILERARSAEAFEPISQRIEAIQGSFLFIDEQITYGKHIYRLQLIGVNGNISYSALLEVWYKAQMPYVVYPNPVKDVIQLKRMREIRQPNIFKLWNMHGQMLKSWTLTPAEIQKGGELPIHSLSSGVYLLDICEPSNESIQTIKLQIRQ